MGTSGADRIVIVGGGAGGLELACKLGRKFGRRRVTLVERNLYHIWKPSLHEVAAGTLDMNQEALSYSMLAHRNDFTFVLGAFTGLDLERREITVAAFRTAAGEVLLPERKVSFSRLCIAVGSTSNYFGTPGAPENTISLDSPADAEHFRLEILKHMIRAENQQDPEIDPVVDVVIIGGGATGVELAAELREASKVYGNYGFDRLDPSVHVRITLLEGSPRILAPLPERVSHEAEALLQQRKVKVVCECRAASIESDRVVDQDGKIYPFDLCVWAAGIRAPEFLSTLGLPTTKSGQIEVTRSLNVEGQEHVYAFGDCAACPQPNGKLVPPRAQAAHQQADHLYETFVREFGGRHVTERAYAYRDYGSLVSIGTQTSVGSLMGSLSGRTWFVEGLFARLLYMSLHLMHHRAVLGGLRTAGLALARLLMRRSTALVKLH